MLEQHVSAIHKSGVYHNDLEPRNIVVFKRRISVIDFELSDINHTCLQECDELAPLRCTSNLTPT
jgi:tRNA A-37 threonylcarbamoyl transferase component Bud32